MSNLKKYKILLIEPSQIIRAGLKEILEGGKEFVISSMLSDLEYYTPSKNNMYDLIIINPIVVNYNQRTDIRAFLSLKNLTILYALTYYPYEEGVMHQYDGCIFLNDNKEQLYKKLKKSLQNVNHSSSVASNELSTRERSILAAVAQGKTNKEIADEFNLSIYTVITHRKNISNKLGINTIPGLTVYAIMNKMIDVKDF